MCRKYGYSVEKPGFLYIIGFESFIGFGITNFPTARYASHNKTFKKHGITEILIAEISGSGRFINELERHLKVVLPIVDSGLEGFKTECILLGDKELLFTEIEAFKWKFGGLT